MKLYDLLSAHHAPAPGSFITLAGEDRKRYFREAQRRCRGAQRDAVKQGSPTGSAANVRQVLADAALMILAVGAPGADQIRQVLASVYATRPGIPIRVEEQAKTGKLKPKMTGRPT